MNRALLEKPFDPAQIKQRQGYFGHILDYIEGHAVIARLNEAFDVNWTFEVTEHCYHHLRTDPPPTEMRTH
jgi:recombination DNA repair RAD52 pathway protein